MKYTAAALGGDEYKRCVMDEPQKRRGFFGTSNVSDIPC